MATGGGRGKVDEKGQVRISFTVDKEIRKNVRISAAHADMEPNEWIVMILEKYADKAVPQATRTKG